MNHPTFLRRVLFADAATSGACGLLMLFGGGFLEQILGVSGTLLRYSGVSLLPFAAFVCYIATRAVISRPAVWTVVALNVLWAADSVLMLATGWIEPTRLGYGFVIAQAVIVALFAEFQYLGLRQGQAKVV